MRDFTLKAYCHYIELIKSKFPNIIRFDEYFDAKASGDAFDSFCLLRHDVDRRVGHTMAMAEAEHKLGVRSTYYFRTRSHVFKPELIRRIAGMGHEIGYHYESLSDSNGDIEAALADFERELEKIRKVAEIRTIAMHGSALKGIDNRDLWRDAGRHQLLADRFDLLGEVYLDIDYTDICYLSDTGRRWYTDKNNIRDRVSSTVDADFDSRDDLVEYLSGAPHPKFVFQTHPERYSPTTADYLIDWSRDQAANYAKRFFKALRRIRRS